MSTDYLANFSHHGKITRNQAILQLSLNHKDTHVSERATAYSIPPQATIPSTNQELAVRPKVLRRPAHFNTKSMIEAPAPILIPLHSETTMAEKTTPAFRAWQDDGKFAITLLALVIIVNLAVSAWLSAISPSKNVAVQQTVTNAASPATTSIHVLDTNARDISEQ